MNSVNNIAPAKIDFQQKASQTTKTKDGNEFQSLLKDTMNKAKAAESNNKNQEKGKADLKNNKNKPESDDKDQQGITDDIGLATNPTGENQVTVQTNHPNLGAQENLTSNLGLMGLFVQGSQTSNVAQPIQNVQGNVTEINVVGNPTETNKSQAIALNEQLAKINGKLDKAQSQIAILNDGKPMTTVSSNVQEVKEGKNAVITQQIKQDTIPTEKTEGNDVKSPNELGITLKTQSLDFNKVNIKVADNANLQKQALPNQIAEKIIYNKSQGKNEFDIQLYPKDLGKIGIKLVFEGNGAQILVSCNNPKTQSLMAAHADSLRGILETNTGLQTTVSVQEESGMMNQHHRESFDGRGQNQSQYQQENARYQTQKDEENISFLNQLKFGLLEQNSFLS